MANADIGKINFRNHTPYLNNVVSLSHAPNSEEGYNSTGNRDGLYGGHSVFDIEGKIISRIDDLVRPELKSDVRPEYSKSVFNCEMSLRSPDESPIDTTSWIDKSNTLDTWFPLEDYYFANEPLALQITQMDGDPNIVGQVYDLRKEIAYGGGTGIIPLPDLNGVYDSQAVYGKFSVSFDRHYADFNNDGVVDWVDFTVLAGDWGKGIPSIGGVPGVPYNSLADIAVTPGHDPIALPGTTTSYFDGVVDWADVASFAQSWLAGN